MPQATIAEEKETLADLDRNFLLYASSCLKIIDKRARLVKLEPNAGQIVLEGLLAEQEKAGKPRRAIALKARQVGVSTHCQGKLIQNCTLRANQNAVVVAHDAKTGDKLFTMGQTMYGNLPDWEIAGQKIKPPIRHHRRGRYLHFAPPGEAWMGGSLFPNSSYFVDTAGEFQSGRGGTYQLAHLSEFAFWDNQAVKLTSLLSAVPDTPDSLVVIESTANGNNLFKDLWDRAEMGESDFAPFFWPWYREPAYSLPFANVAEERGLENSLGTGPYGDDEPELVNLIGKSFNHDEVLQKLHWRRRTIANTTFGQTEVFHQEFPSTPEEAFIASGRQVFSPSYTRPILAATEDTDPRIPNETFPGPLVGRFDAKAAVTKPTRTGFQAVPTDSEWTPEPSLRIPWRLWVPGDRNKPEIEKKRRFVIAVDPSSGEEMEGSGTAYHAIEVIDHLTREQVGEYRARVDPDLLAQEIILAALFFNRAWIGVEITGGWGLPIIRRIAMDYRYPHVYIRRSHEQTFDHQQDRLGWSTDRRTKPIIEAGAAELLREGSHGIKSRLLANELLTYVRDERGRTGPEPGKFSDLLLAWMIAQQIAFELPMRPEKKTTVKPYAPANSVTGY